MVDKIDSSMSFTIGRILVEGNLQITGIGSDASEYVPGDVFRLGIDITNLGGDDTGFIWIKDADTGEYILKNGKFDAPRGVSFRVYIDGLVMPNKDWNLLVEAGHVE